MLAIVSFEKLKLTPHAHGKTVKSFNNTLPKINSFQPFFIKPSTTCSFLNLIRKSSSQLKLETIHRNHGSFIIKHIRHSNMNNHLGIIFEIHFVTHSLG